MVVFRERVKLTANFDALCDATTSSPNPYPVKPLSVYFGPLGGLHLVLKSRLGTVLIAGGMGQR